MALSADMDRHFTRVAPLYRDIRTTDAAPVERIADSLRGLERVRAVDVGCGSGRYDLLLFERLANLHLLCVDANRAMLAKAAELLRDAGIRDFETVCADVAELALAPGSLDCAVTFNAIHHIGFANFLEKMRTALRPGGHLFVYTRLPEQNARTIWGRHFPGFAERETRLYGLDEMYRRIEERDGLRFAAANAYRFRREASLERLLEQARRRHYSTLALYSGAELERGLTAFEGELRRRYDDLDRITWYDENILVEARRLEA